MTDPFSLDEEYSHRCKDVVCSCRTPGQIFRDWHCSDDNVCGTKTEYQQHNVLGFPPKRSRDMLKKKTLELVDEQILNITADGEVFVIAAKSRVINLKDVINYELSGVPP